MHPKKKKKDGGTSSLRSAEKRGSRANLEAVKKVPHYKVPKQCRTEDYPEVSNLSELQTEAIRLDNELYELALEERRYQQGMRNNDNKNGVNVHDVWSRKGEQGARRKKGRARANVTPNAAAAHPSDVTSSVDISPLLKQMVTRAKSATVLWAKDHEAEVRAHRANHKNPGDFQHTAATLFHQLLEDEQNKYREKARIAKEKDQEEGALQWEQYVESPTSLLKPR